MNKFKVTPTMISILAEALQNDILSEGETFIVKIEAFVRKMEQGGMSEAKITERLLRDFDSEGGGIFGSLKNRIGIRTGAFMESLSQQEQDSVMAEENPDLADQEMMWVATLMNSCADCVDLHGEVKTQSDWEAEGIPNVRPTPCTFSGYCHCTLIPTGTLTEEDRLSITEPIKIRKDMIQDYAKQRMENGVRLSDTYKQALLGQANNQDGVL